jgi:hypothetical protein
MELDMDMSFMSVCLIRSIQRLSLGWKILMIPGTLWLMLAGLGGIIAHKKAALRRPLNFSPDVEVTISDYLHITPS